MNERELFIAALRLTNLTARAAFLEQACGHDQTLRQQVEALLAEHDKGGSFLEAPAPGLAENAVTVTIAGDAPEERSKSEATGSYHDTNEGAGAVIAGRYTLVEVIGEGGMGSVWRAKQTAPVKRFVAVKLIKAGMDSKQVLARFEAERQALALMDHPNIAKVLDGGLHEQRPYFVMELVKGVPITDYCDSCKLTPQQRLELFVPVCHAIQHAHQKGIIHRDIKPSNVLVALYDDKPVVKVIDFGVAKATGGTLTERTIDTGFGGVVGTPQYMSPEQATFNNLDIDTRSDVYALGVLLYELLTGSPPFSKKELEKKGLLEILRVVREEEPPRPSTKLSTADALASLSANRGTEPKKLTGLLRNELDWIVMKALEKDRTRRYETANGFAADVLRYLSGEAVQAHPPSVGYRLKKFVRRNRGQVIAASIVLLVLLGGILGTTLGLIEAQRQEKEAKEQESLARTETIEKEKALQEEAKRVVERDAALKAEAERSNELRHRLGVNAQILANAAYDNRDYKLTTERLDTVPQEQRGWEWQYLKRQLNGGIFTLHGHRGSVSCVVFSPDGTLLATGGGDESSPFEVKLWDARTGLFLFDLKGLPATLGPAAVAPIVCVQFSADSKRLITAGGDKTARVWDAKTGALQLELNDHLGEVPCASFSPDGTQIVTGEAGLVSLVRLWDARTGKLVRDWKAGRHLVNRVAFSPDGTQIVTGSYDQAVRLWDAKTGASLLDVKGVTSGESNVAFSPDGTRLLVAGREEGTSCMLDARTGNVLLTLRGRPRVSDAIGMATQGVLTVAFSPDGTRLLTGGTTGGFGTGTASVWDARTGAELLELKGHRGVVLGAAFSPDGARLITGSADGTAKVWDARTGTPRLELGSKDPVASAAFSADGAWVVTGGGALQQPGYATVWEARTGLPLVELKHFQGMVRCVAFSADGTRLITGGGLAGGPEGQFGGGEPVGQFGGGKPSKKAGAATIWDARTGTPLVELKGLQDTVGSVAFSPDGTRVVTTGYRAKTVGGAELKVWDALSGALLFDLSQPDQRVTSGGERGGSVAFSSDNTRFVTGGVRHMKSLGDEVKVWDTRTGTTLMTLQGSKGAVLSVAFSKDGTRIAAGHYSKTVTVWDAHTGTVLNELKGHTSNVNSVAFNADGTRLVTGAGDSSVRIWDVRTGTTLAELKGHTGSVTSVSFSADGTQILTASRGGEVFVWYARPMQMMELAHTSWVQRVVFSPDSTRLATSSESIKLWEARTGKLLLELKGFKSAADHLAFNADGTQLAAGGDQSTVKVWDTQTGKELSEIKTGPQLRLAFARNGTQLITEGHDQISKVWDLKTGLEILGEPLPATVPSEPISPDRRFFARINADRVEVLPFVSNAEEIAYRQLHTKPDLRRHRTGYLAARLAKNDFAAAFNLNLIPLAERKAVLEQAEGDAFAALNKLAVEHQGAGKLDEAVPLLHEILKINKAKRGPEDPATLQTIDMLGQLYHEMSQFEKAIPLLEEVLQVRKKLDPDSPETLSTMGMLGVVYKDAGRFKEALALLEVAATKDEGVVETLLDVYALAGEHAKLIALSLQRLETIQKAPPEARGEAPNIHARLGRAYLAQQKWTEAETHLRECVTLFEKYMVDDWRSFDAMSQLGGALLGQKKYTDAEPLLLKGYEGLKKRAPSIEPANASCLPDALDRLLELYQATNKPDEVKKYQELRAKYPPPNAKMPEKK